MAKRDLIVAEHIFDTPEATLLDLVDELLNKGVVADGDVTLGVAGIDLIYLRLSALLCAADRVLPRDPTVPARRRRHRQPGTAKRLK
jgi:hypothetical protein